MKTLKKLLFAALATIGFTFAAQAATYGPNLIKNGTFALKEDVEDKSGGYSEKANLDNPFTKANPFCKSLDENTWYGFRANNTQNPSTSNDDNYIGWKTTQTHDTGTAAGFLGKSGVVCANFTVPVGGAGTYAFQYWGRTKGTSYTARMTVYLTKSENITTATDFWPGGSSDAALNATRLKKVWPWIVPVKHYSTGEMTNSIAFVNTGWKTMTGTVELEEGDYTIAFCGISHIKESSTSSPNVKSGMPLYIDDISLRQIIPSTVTVDIASDPAKVDYSAVLDGATPFVSGGTAVEGSTIDVVATPKDGYKYMTIPEGWFEGEGGSITNSFVVPGEDFTITIEDPVEDADAKITFVDSEFATYSAKIGDDPIESGASIALGSLVDVVATPDDGYRYLAIPEGWEDGDEDGSIKMTVEVLEKTTEITIPDPVAARQVRIASNDTVDYEALTNEVMIASGDYLPVDAVVQVNVTPKTGYWWTEVPEAWQGEVGMGTISNTYTVVASEDLAITLPIAAEHLVTVTVVNPLEKATYQLSVDGEPIESGAKVLYGTVVTVTVTSADPDYEYSKAPTGWTGGGATITREITIDDDTKDIVIPYTNFGKRQIAVNFVAKGVTYVATNLTTNTQLKNGGKADFDAQVRIVAAPYSGEYVFDKELPEGWSFGENGVIVGEVAAASSIEIPVAAWTPTDGELIENGGFEYLDASEYSCAKGFPASLAGSWGGYCSGSMIQSNCYGLWKKGGSVYSNWTVWGSPHGGTYAAGANADGASSAYITVTFTTPSQSRLSSEYKFNFYAKAWRDTDSKRLASVKVLLKKGTSTKQTLEGGSLNGSWKLFEYTLTNLEKDTEYTLQFLPNEAQRSFAIDDVSLKLVPVKGLAIMFY